MKTNLSVLLCFLGILLFSCQREVDLPTPNTNTGADERLVKIVGTDGTDSTVSTYSYDANGRISENKVVDIYNGIDFGYTTKVVRNSSGIITRTIEIEPSLVGVDSTIRNFHYSAGKYTSSVSSITSLGFTSADSTVYTYNSSGQISKDEVYSSVNGSPFVLALKNDYTYTSAGNLASHKQSTYNPATSTYFEEYTESYTYDAKTNPLVLGNESIFMYLLEFTGPNNATGYTYVEPASPGSNENLSVIYTYNGDNKPLSAVINSGTSTTNINFHYQ